MEYNPYETNILTSQSESKDIIYGTSIESADSASSLYPTSNNNQPEPRCIYELFGGLFDVTE